jgi:hypothetical protein
MVNPPSCLIFSVNLMKNSVFSIEKYRVFNFSKILLNFKYFLFKIFNNSEDSHLQAKSTRHSVKNWNFINNVETLTHKTSCGFHTNLCEFKSHMVSHEIFLGVVKFIAIHTKIQRNK